ncbi:MAG: ATP-dependent DNA helicase RecG [Bacteroidia bacterium]|nr:ATP-dependent DNA helicase RecG [Bacteroidia bacterium]
MEALELLEILSGGETSTVQFKEDVTNVRSIAQEITAFSNAKGGRLIIGVNDRTGNIKGLDFQAIQRINNLLTTAANEHVKSAVIISTETVDVNGQKTIVVDVPEGANKPYRDNDGVVWIKNGSDKRKVTSNEETAQLLQRVASLYAENILLPRPASEHLDLNYFRAFYQKKYKRDLPTGEQALNQVLENLYLGEEGKINLACNLLFAKNPQRLTPDFYISAVWFPGTAITHSSYLSSDNIGGKLANQYELGKRFIISTLRKVQAGQSFNSLGLLEIPEDVIDELLINALLHRDYFIKDSIKVFVFDDRVEIKSPGKLPNSLTVERIKQGLRRTRNATLNSFAFDLIPYRGVGSGILRSLELYPNIDFINDEIGEQFTVIIKRPSLI